MLAVVSKEQKRASVAGRPTPEILLAANWLQVEDKDILMIVPKSEEQEIKELRETVMKDFGEDLG